MQTCLHDYHFSDIEFLKLGKQTQIKTAKLVDADKFESSFIFYINLLVITSSPAPSSQQVLLVCKYCLHLTQNMNEPLCCEWTLLCSV